MSAGPSPKAPIQNQEPRSNRPSFTSYLETPNLSSKIKFLYEIIANTNSVSVEQVLDDSVPDLRITQEEVEEVLKLSYGFPGGAVKFFRWSARMLNGNHSPYAWNLVVDMLGKNLLFDAMWDVVKSMLRDRLLSLATFASVFSSFVMAGKAEEAFLTFNIMDKYGVPRDVVALNSLLSAICRDGRVVDVVDSFSAAKVTLRPDMDTYAILLEGCEKEGTLGVAKLTFAEMVAEIGWDPANLPAYSSFLCTLLKGRYRISEAMTGFEMMRERRCYPGMKFLRDALNECLRRKDYKAAEFFWEAMVERVRMKPGMELYNLMIRIRCHSNRAESSKRLLDEMAHVGAFPDESTYNVLLQFYIKSRKLKDASALFAEMIKNECLPTLGNCNAAVGVFIDAGDSYMAVKVWKWMVANYKSELDETANLLVLGLRDMNRLPEAVKYAEDIIKREIKLSSSTLSKLKQNLAKARKEHVYDELLRKWKL